MRTPHRIVSLAAPAVLVGAAILMARVFGPGFGDGFPHLLFLVAVLGAGWYGGAAAGALAIALSVVAARTQALWHPGSAGAAEPWVPLALFAATAAAITWLNHRRLSAEAGHRGAAALATASAEGLAAVVNTAVDGIVVIDTAGRVEAFNRGAERLFGYTAAEVVGRNVNMLMPAPYHEAHDGYLARYLATGTASIIGIGRQVEGLRKDGTRLPLHLSVGETDVDGERRFTGMLHDLSDRVRLEEQLRASEARWRSVVESAVDAIVVIDARGAIEAFNPAAERLFGHTEADVLGRNVSLLMPSPDHEQHDHYLARYLATGRPTIIGRGREVTGLRKDGSRFPLHLSVGATTLAGERKFTGILHDLTARVQMEDRLREQAALARLGEMAAVIAHEVRNPLAGVRGAIQIIGKRLPADAAERPVVAEIVGRIDALKRMMDDILLFARPPVPKPAPIDLGAMVAATAGLLSQDPAWRGVTVEVEGPACLVEADGELLKIVFLNLLVNGAQAMQGRGRIHVRLDSSLDRCRVEVGDQGPGISEELREKIFTPFFTTKARGTGLGLPTVKRLVEAHGGSVTIECPPQGGTTVTIELPRRPHAASLPS